MSARYLAANSSGVVPAASRPAVRVKLDGPTGHLYFAQIRIFLLCSDTGAGSSTGLRRAGKPFRLCGRIDSPFTCRGEAVNEAQREQRPGVVDERIEEGGAATSSACP